MIGKGTRVAIRQRLLEPDERAPGLPDDTASLPYGATIRGTLTTDARLGDRVTIRTAAGRLLVGELTEAEPGDHHGFGTPVPALVAAGDAIAEMLRAHRA